jgi:RNA-directed DNA polymerase
MCLPNFRFTPRGYLHFDSPISREGAEAIATDPQMVARHSFYPFITYPIVTQKIRKGEDDRVVKLAPKTRWIAYAAHKDSHIFTHYSEILMARYEPALRERDLHESVTAFRSINRQRNIHFANHVFDFIAATGPCAVLAMDFSDFFGNLDHAHLKDAWRRLLNEEVLPEDHYAVFKGITRFCTVERDLLYRALGIDPRDPIRRHRLCSAREFREIVRGGNLLQPNERPRGIPQGSPISAVLSNVYMMEFDQEVNAFAVAHGGLYRRYCDDILLVLPTSELRQGAIELVRRLCGEFFLPVNEEKTELIDFTIEGGRLTTLKPLQYLGFTFDGRNKRIRPASVARYYKKMRKGVRRAKAIRARSDEARGIPFRTYLKRKKLYRLYSYLGRRNFLSYAFEAARIMRDPGIKKQVKKHWRRLQEAIRG